MTLYTEGFSRLVASTAAPITTGWSDSCRVGFAPTERPCLCTARVNFRGMWGHVRLRRDTSMCEVPGAAVATAICDRSVLACYAMERFARGWLSVRARQD